jgi:5-methylcytosine-specific restriction endonuclease McrA
MIDIKICNVCKQEKPVTDFYNKQHKCKSCSKDQANAWRKANPDKVKRSWQRSNRKRWKEQKLDPVYMEKKKLYRQATRSVRIEKSRAWNQANRDRFNRHVYKSHTAKRAKNLGRNTYKILDKEIARIQSMPCYFCGTTENITIHHAIPLSRQGNHSIGNLEPLCRPCSSSKKKKLNSEYRYWLSKQ